jgi:5-formyltetrahydrofolate cyclo-ligase
VHGRIPNFTGAEKAAELLLAHPAFNRVKVIKVNPDSPQRWVRKLALERGIMVVTPTPRLKGAFRVLDPAKIPPERYGDAATLKRGGHWGEDVPLDALPKVDLVVMGSVAVTPEGRRVGKGHGYADLEYGLLRELGNPAVPVATTVHPLQIVGDFPTEPHDLAVSIIATPDEVLEVKRPPPPPKGIDWARLPQAALEEMPVIAELRRLLEGRRCSRGKAGRRCPSRK